MKEQNKMKKLMIAAAIVCAAAFAQAANYTWSSTSVLYTWDSPEPDYPVIANQTAYLVFADAYSQSALVNDFAAGTVDYTKLSAAGNGATTAEGLIGDTSASSSYTQDMQAYFVVFEAGNETMFVSGEVSAGYDSMGNYTPVMFGDTEVASLWTGERFDAAAGYVGGGYYAAVPEPTSGLLLLLGVAGLALKRKRA